GSLHQRLQDLERSGVELQQLALAADLERIQVVFQVADLQHPRLHPATAAQQRVEPDLHFLQCERLDQVVVRPGVEAGKLVVQAVAGGEHQHRGLLAGLVAQLAAYLQAVHAGQVEVKHDGVEFVDNRQMQAGDAIGREINGMAAFFKVIAEIGGDVLVVLDDEYAHRRSLPDGCRDSGTQPREAGVAAALARIKDPGRARVKGSKS